MATLDAMWPSITDDSTVLKKATFDSVKGAIEDNIHSTTNPTIAVKDAIDEMVDARGNCADVDTRLSSVIDDDGAFIIPSTLVAEADISQSLFDYNLVRNGNFSLWSVGDTSAPDHWFQGYGSLTYQKTGNGMADTRNKYGRYGVRLLNTGSSGFSQYIFDAGAFPRVSTFAKGRKFSAGAWIYATQSNHVSIRVGDGTGTTYTMHTGNSTWQWLEVTRTIDNAATQLYVQIQMLGNSNVYVSGVHACFNNYSPGRPQISPNMCASTCFRMTGLLSVLDDAYELLISQPAKLEALHAYCTTSPSGGDLTVDFLRYNGATWDSVTGGTVTLVANGAAAGVIPFTTAPYYMSKGTLDVGIPNNSLYRLDIKAVNNAADASFRLTYVTPNNYADAWRTYNDL